MNACQRRGYWHGPEWECPACSDFRPKEGFFGFREARPKSVPTIDVTVVVQQLVVVEKLSFMEWLEDLFT